MSIHIVSGVIFGCVLLVLLGTNMHISNLSNLFITSVSGPEPTECTQGKQGQCHVCAQVDSQGGQLEVIDRGEVVVLVDDSTHTLKLLLVRYM